MIPLAVLAAAMEATGAAAVFGLIKILGDPTQASRLPVVSAIYNVLPWHDNKSIVLSFTFLVALFYISKNTLLAGVAFARARSRTNRWRRSQAECCRATWPCLTPFTSGATRPI